MTALPRNTISRPGEKLMTAAVIAAACGTNILILGGIYLPWLSPAAGFSLRNRIASLDAFTKDRLAD